MKFKLFGIMWDFTEARLWLTVIFDPTYWLQSDPQDKQWDKKMRNELKNAVFTELESSHVKLNGRRIWISNFPYAFGSDAEKSIRGDRLPSRRTRILLREAINNSRY